MRNFITLYVLTLAMIALLPPNIKGDETERERKVKIAIALAVPKVDKVEQPAPKENKLDWMIYSEVETAPEPRPLVSDAPNPVKLEPSSEYGRAIEKVKQGTRITLVVKPGYRKYNATETLVIVNDAPNSIVPGVYECYLLSGVPTMKLIESFTSTQLVPYKPGS